ncbi:MAG: SDR family NAD(P)-dependent oxidoreductase [Reyranellaceae bacterium]
MSVSLSWTGKSVWILGASSGLGEALARELAARGARLALSARSAEALKALAAGLLGSGHRALPLDVVDPEALADTVARLQSDWGGVDAVVLAAAIQSPRRVFALDLEAARQTVRVNVEGALNCLAAIVPPMLAAGRGHIAVIAGVAGYRGLPQAAADGASKAALINLTETLRLDLADRGIKVQLINPGLGRTGPAAKPGFRLPAPMEPARAARCIADGMESERFEIHFPQRLTWLLKLLRLLPYPLYFPLVRRAIGR